MEPSIRIALHPPRIWGGWLKQAVFSIGAGALLGAALALFDDDSPSLLAVAIALGLLLVFGAVVVGILFLIRRASIGTYMPAIVVDADGLDLPLHSDAKKALRVPFTDVRSVTLWGANPSRRLVMIDTASRAFSYPLRTFVEADAFEQLSRAISERIGQLPDAPARMAAFRQRTSLADPLRERGTRMTRVVLASIVLPALLPLWDPTFGDVMGLVRLGANVPALVADGQWYRLVSPNVLHAGWLHVLFNASAAFALCSLIERLMGPQRLLVIYGVSGVLAAAASAWGAGHAISVGASGAIFGLFGALAVVHWRFRDALPAGVRIPRRSWVLLIVLNGGISLLPQVDGTAHLGGLLAGALVTWWMARGALLPDELHAASRAITLCSLVVGALLLAGVGQAVIVAGRWSTRDQLVAARALLSLDAPDAINAGAWEIATSIEASSGQINDALAAMRSVVARQDTDDAAYAAYMDTLATLLNRMGDTGGAVATEHTAMQVAGAVDFYPSQLARFLHAHRKKHDTMLRGSLTADDVVLSVLEPAAVGVPAPLRLITRRSLPGGVTIYAYGLRNGEVTGLLEVHMPGDPSAPCDVFPTRLDHGWKDGTTFVLGMLVAPRELYDGTAECVTFYRPMEPSVARLP